MCNLKFLNVAFRTCCLSAPLKIGTFENKSFVLTITDHTLCLNKWFLSKIVGSYSNGRMTPVLKKIKAPHICEDSPLMSK